MKAYFNERGWYINGDEGRSVVILFDDEPPTAIHAYDRRWYVFCEMLLCIKQMNFNITEAFTDSRIVEELSGEIGCQSRYANECRIFYISEFYNMSVKKCDAAKINSKIDSHEMPEYRK